MRFSYPYETEADGDSTVVHFPDIPEAITQVDPEEDFDAVVGDCLMAAMRTYVEGRQLLVKPSPARGRGVATLDALTSAKLALYSAIRAKRIRNVQLAALLGVSEGAVRRLLDLDHRSHIGQVEKALEALGQRLEVSVKAA